MYINYTLNSVSLRMHQLYPIQYKLPHSVYIDYTLYTASLRIHHTVEFSALTSDTWDK